MSIGRLESACLFLPFFLNASLSREIHASRVSRDRVWVVESCVLIGDCFSMTRQEDGTFKDEQLAQIIFEA